MEIKTTISSVQTFLDSKSHEIFSFLRKYGFKIHDSSYIEPLDWICVHLDDKEAIVNSSLQGDRNETLVLDFPGLKALIENNFQPEFVFELGKKYYGRYSWVMPVEHWTGKIVLAGRGNDPFKLYRGDPMFQADAVNYIKTHFPYDSPKIQD